MNNTFTGRSLKPIAKRTLSRLSTACGDEFSLVTYNCLADCYVCSSDFLCARKFLCREGADSWRHKTLVAEVESLDADILCLQEVDSSYFALLQKRLLTLGYRGVFLQKKLDFTDGVATFFKENTFELVSAKMEILSDLIESLGCSTKPFPQVLLLLALRHLKTGSLFAVGNVHIVWGDLLHTITQAFQISVSAQALQAFVESLSSDDNKVPYILCGDFNIEPNFPAYKILSGGHLKDADVEMIRDVKYIEWNTAPSKLSEEELALFDQWQDSCTSPLKSLQSAYKCVLGGEPAFTCSSLVRLQTLDYIWFSSQNLKVTAVLGTTTESEIKPIGSIPNEDFSSDHLPLKAYFEFH